MSVISQNAVIPARPYHVFGIRGSDNSLYPTGGENFFDMTGHRCRAY